MQLDTPEQVEQFCSGITLKPGTELWVDISGSQPGICRVQISGYEPDSDDPTQITMVNYSAFVRLPIRTEALVSFLFYAYRDRAMHECKEWFKVDGKRVFLPHVPAMEVNKARQIGSVSGGVEWPEEPRFGTGD